MAPVGTAWIAATAAVAPIGVFAYNVGMGWGESFWCGFMPAPPTTSPVAQAGRFVGHALALVQGVYEIVRPRRRFERRRNHWRYGGRRGGDRRAGGVAGRGRRCAWRHDDLYGW